MVEGVLRHYTDMTVERQYTDCHGQSEVAFAFCKLLGFDLLPRLKAIHLQRLYRTDNTVSYPALARVLSKTIDWELIAQQYDQMVKYATPSESAPQTPKTFSADLIAPTCSIPSIALSHSWAKRSKPSSR